MSTTNGKTLTYRVERLEKESECLNGKIDEILTNHLPHIQESLARLETRILMFTAINVGTVVFAILLHEIL